MALTPLAVVIFLCHVVGTDAWTTSWMVRDNAACRTNHHYRSQYPNPPEISKSRSSVVKLLMSNHDRNDQLSHCNDTSRRIFLLSSSIATSATTAAIFGMSYEIIAHPTIANAVGPVKIALTPLKYSAVICPPDRPIPGEKAMIGMRGLCVTVDAKLESSSPKELEKVGVYGFVNDGITGDSVLANNPDGGTDAGQFAMIETITPKDSIVQFEFIAAVPRDKDLSQYENGIGPLDFSSLRLISYPGGQQFGAISPCEMNEFSDECEAWEAENGPYKKADFMVKSNPRTKGY
jgi:hypothetical protein